MFQNQLPEKCPSKQKILSTYNLYDGCSRMNGKFSGKLWCRFKFANPNLSLRNILHCLYDLKIFCVAIVCGCGALEPEKYERL